MSNEIDPLLETRVELAEAEITNIYDRLDTLEKALAEARGGRDRLREAIEAVKRRAALGLALVGLVIALGAASPEGRAKAADTWIAACLAVLSGVLLKQRQGSNEDVAI